jgi:predicted component of type VI protein secretion system
LACNPRRFKKAAELDPPLSLLVETRQAASVPPAAGRVVKHVEEHFRTLPDTVAEFDHYAPASSLTERRILRSVVSYGASYLTEHRASVLKKVTDEELEAALARFEKMFSDINALL